MGSPDVYGTTGYGPEDGISPFAGPYVSPGTTAVESADAIIAHLNMTDLTNSLASLSEVPSLASSAYDGNNFGGHQPPSGLSGFPQHSDAIDSITMDPSLFGQLVLTHSPLASPGGVPALGADGAGHLLTPEGPSYFSPPIQESPYPETSPATHAWIAGTVYRSGMWPQQQSLLPQHQGSTKDPQDDQTPLMLRAAGYDETPRPVWTHGGSVAGETSYPLFAGAVRRSGMSPQQQNLPPQPPCSTDHLQDGQIPLMFGPSDYGETPGSIWSPRPSVAGETSMLASSQGGGSTAGEGADPERVKRRRGRPRLYEIDEIQVPKRKPGRPLTYAPVTESFGSRSSMTSSSSTMSPGSVEGSTTPFWEGPSSGGSARSAKRNAPPDESVEQDPAEAAAQAVVRARNKAAATRYRLKTQKTVERVEAEEREASLRRQALLACADRLRGELHDLKTEVMQHANCGCPKISRYISAATQRTLSTITGSSVFQTPVSPSAQELTPTLPYPHLHLASCTWQQGGFAMGAPVPSPYYAASLPSSGAAGQAPADVDGYFGLSMSWSYANDGG